MSTTASRFGSLYYPPELNLPGQRLPVPSVSSWLSYSGQVKEGLYLRLETLIKATLAVCWTRCTLKL